MRDLSLSLPTLKRQKKTNKITIALTQGLGAKKKKKKQSHQNPPLLPSIASPLWTSSFEHTSPGNFPINVCQFVTSSRSLPIYQQNLFPLHLHKNMSSKQRAPEVEVVEERIQWLHDRFSHSVKLREEKWKKLMLSEAAQYLLSHTPCPAKNSPPTITIILLFFLRILYLYLYEKKNNPPYKPTTLFPTEKKTHVPFLLFCVGF